MPVDLGTSIVALPLVFVVPGLGIAAALFPEKLRRGTGLDGPVEVAVLAIVGSLSVTILAGSALAALPVGYSNLGLWTIDGLVGLAGGAVWWIRRTAPAPAEVRDAPSPGVSAWGTLRALERLAGEERALRRQLRSSGKDADERSGLETELERVRAERARLLAMAEAHHAS